MAQFRSVEKVAFVEVPDGIPCVDGIIGTGSPRSVFCVIEADGKGFLLSLSASTTGRAGYLSRHLTAEERGYAPLRNAKFIRETWPGEPVEWGSSREIRLLIPDPRGTQAYPDPVGMVDTGTHAVTLWGHGVYSPEGVV